MFNELYNSVKVRFGQGSSSMGMGDWICANTTIKKRPFSFEGYEFQRAIADDMHPDLTVTKCSQVGLALALDTPIPTPTGWSTMGALQVGDQVYDEQGQPTTVTYKSPVYLDHECYRVTFDDKESIVADGSHRWYVESERLFGFEGSVAGQGKRAKSAGLFKSGVITTKAIAKEFKRDGRHLFSIPNTKPLIGHSETLPLDPYYLGLWLGDGSLNMSVVTTHKDDKEFLVRELTRRGLVCLNMKDRGSVRQFKVHFHDQMPGSGKHKNQHSVSDELRKLGLLGQSKFVPTKYLRASANDRLDVVRGLMDSDGCVAKDGQAYFVNTSPDIVEGMCELLRSLGFKPHVKWKPSERRSLIGGYETDAKPCCTVSFKAYTNDPVVCLMPRKRGRLQRAIKKQAQGPKSRKIVNVELVDTVPVSCISVRSPSHLFLAGRAMVPTHNTEVQIRKYLGMLTRGNSVSGIFTLPNEKMRGRIYSGRIKPILEGDEIFNPPMGVSPVRKQDQIQIRDSFGYITGCVESDATSTSADFLMHDEVDLSPQEILALYQSRLQNSDLQITQKFSTPTFSGFGIDKSYAITDMREFLARCNACNHWQIPRFTPAFVHLNDYPFEVESFTELTSTQIAQLNLEDAYVKCEQCSRRLDLGDPSTREWVATNPSRTAFRGYRVRPFSTSRLRPRYIFGQLAKYQEDNFLRGFYNTVLGEPYSDRSAQLQRADIESCMTSGAIPNIGDDVPVFLGVDIGFQCHITLSIDGPDGVPAFILFESVSIGGLESRISDLRKVYNIVQGASDRFPYTSEVDALRDITGGCIMPVQYRGTAALVPIKDEIGTLTHYSANRTYMLDRIHTFIGHRKMVLSGYGNQKETLITHLSDMHRDEQPDAEAVWIKNSGNDHYFHSMALSLVSRRICEHMFHRQDTPPAMTPDFMGTNWVSSGSSLLGDGVRKHSRLGMRQ